MSDTIILDLQEIEECLFTNNPYCPLPADNGSKPDSRQLSFHFEPPLDSSATCNETPLPC